jgi:hypothetical protein
MLEKWLTPYIQALMLPRARWTTISHLAVATASFLGIRAHRVVLRFSLNPSSHDQPSSIKRCALLCDHATHGVGEQGSTPLLHTCVDRCESVAPDGDLPANIPLPDDIAHTVILLACPRCNLRVKGRSSVHRSRTPRPGLHTTADRDLAEMPPYAPPCPCVCLRTPAFLCSQV